MIYQSHDIAYGIQREDANHNRIEQLLNCPLERLGKYSIMDWKEIQTKDLDSPPWLVEQKARKMSYSYALACFRSPVGDIPSVMIGKNKLDYMKDNGGAGIVIFDFTDKLMYWVFDEDEYNTFEVEVDFVRKKRADCNDQPHPVVHIPCSKLIECP